MRSNYALTAVHLWSHFFQNHRSPCSNKGMSVSSIRSGAHKHCFALISHWLCFCASEPWPACYAITPVLLGSSLSSVQVSSGVMLQPQSGQAIFVGPHWCNSHFSQMIDSAGFVAAQFPVIVLPVSAVEKLQDKPLIQYLQYLTYFYSSCPSLCDRKAFGQRKKRFLSFNNQTGFRWGVTLAPALLHC